jgi:hypothetical protein
MHMEITITTLLRVQHTYLLMKRPLMIVETITPGESKLLMALLHLVSCRLTCTSLSMLALKHGVLAAHCACIVEFIQDNEHDLKLSDDHHKFLILLYQ